MQDFTRHPNALHRLYTRLPDFQAVHALAYDVICDYYNEDYGYAWPTQYELYLRLGCGVNAPGKIVAVLEKYELISARRIRGKNYVYVPHEPIRDEAALYAKWPEAKAHYDARVEYIAQRKTDSEADLREFLAEIERKESEGQSEDDDLIDYI